MHLPSFKFEINSETNLHALLSSLDSSDIASNATTDNDKVLLLCKKIRSAGCSGSCSDELGGNIPASEAYPRLNRDREGAETTLGSLVNKKKSMLVDEPFFSSMTDLAQQKEAGLI